MSGDDARGDAAARGPSAREGVRHHGRPARRAVGSRWRRPMPAPRRARSARRGRARPDDRRCDCRRPSPTRSSSAARPARSSSRPSRHSTSRCRARMPRSRVRSRPSQSTSGCSPSTRTTSAATRCCIRWLARTTSSAGPKRRWTSCSASSASSATRVTATRCSSGAASTTSRGAGFATRKPLTSRSSRPGARSDFYELALYKLGWSLYKQDFYDEALHRYMALLDYKLSVGYDFDQQHAEEDERRVADTFRVISLSFSNLGGPEVLGEYYARQRQSQLRGSDLPEPRRVLLRQAALQRRGGRLRLVRRALSVPSRVARVRHARHRHLRRRRFPEARRRVEEVVRDASTACRASTGSTSTRPSGPRCSRT